MVTNYLNQLVLKSLDLKMKIIEDLTELVS